MSKRNLWLLALAIFAAIIVTLTYKSRPALTPEPASLFQNRPGEVLDVSTWQTYTNADLGIEMKYPAETLKLDSEQAMLYHELKNFHATSLRDGSDLGLARDFTVTLSRDLGTCFSLDASSTGLGKDFVIGSIHGRSYEMGAEGEGVVYYCVKDAQDRVALMIERGILSEGYGQITKAPDYFSSRQQTELFEKMLATLTFADQPAKAAVKVYLFNEGLAPINTCREVVAVTRVIDAVPKIATAAINELLKGPTEAEKAEGYTSVIPAGSKLNSLTIVNGEARADFNGTTESGGGSCGQGIVTSQIRETIKQFSSIKSVVLSVDGRTDDIFQP